MLVNTKCLEETKKIKKILDVNQDKRILILGTYCTGKSVILKNLGYGEDFTKVFDELLVNEYGYINDVYVSNQDKEEIKKKISVKKGIPMFSTSYLSCDLILFLHINLPLLKLRTVQSNYSFVHAKLLQEKLFREVLHGDIPYKVIEVEPKELELDKMGRKLYICGDKYRCISLTDKRKQALEYYEKEEAFLVRFPFITYVSSLEELARKQGFMLIVFEELLPKTLKEIDMKYRKLFNHFKVILIVTDDYKKERKRYKYANIVYITRQEAEHIDFDESVMEFYIEYLLQPKSRKLNEKSRKRLDTIYQYLKRKKVVSTPELASYFHLSFRQVERFMNDLNTIYKNIGYDYQENVWYII